MRGLLGVCVSVMLLVMLLFVTACGDEVIGAVSHTVEVKAVWENNKRYMNGLRCHVYVYDQGVWVYKDSRTTNIFGEVVIKVNAPKQTIMITFVADDGATFPSSEEYSSGYCLQVVKVVTVIR